MKLTYNTSDRPGGMRTIIYAFQQLLAIMAATIAVPMIISGIYDGVGAVTLDTSAALFGAGIGTLLYVLFTKGRSPVFLGSSFAFLGSMSTAFSSLPAAFAGAISMSFGFFGLIIGAVFAGLVYLVLALIVKISGVNWINKLMPAAVIGPIVSIIGLSLAGNAVGDLQTGSYKVAQVTKVIKEIGGVDTIVEETTSVATASIYVCIACGLITLFVTMLTSVYGNKRLKLIPFIIGILSGYAAAAIFTIIGIQTGNDALRVIDFSGFTALTEGGVSLATFLRVPDFTFIHAFGDIGKMNGKYILTIAAAYVPVAFVVFAEHIADHKNISSIIEKDLLTDPGLHRTLLGDGVGSMAGAFFGGAPNTTYGESVACVAISGNASVITTITTAILALAISFIAPFSAFLATIPSCVMGGVCISLYGFIAVSGLKMIKNVDLEENSNLFTVSVILISGIGGLAITFGSITITSVAVSLILGIIANVILHRKKKKSENVTKD